MKSIYVIVTTLLIISCTTTRVKNFFKQPAVENTHSIKNFLLENNFSIENSFILKGDTSTAISNLFLGLTDGYFFFDHKGDLLCYNSLETCQGAQFKLLIGNNPDSFNICNDSKISLSKVLSQTYDFDEKPVYISNFQASEYYIVCYWQKFMGGRKGYKELVSWMEEELKLKTSGSKFTLIKINTDLQENWGLIPGAKAKLIYKSFDNRMTLEVVDLPIKK